MAQNNRKFLETLKSILVQNTLAGDAMPVNINIGPPISSTPQLSPTSMSAIAFPCVTCHGTGYYNSAPCPSCHGHAVKTAAEWVTTKRRPRGQKGLPPEGKVCLVWLEGEHLPYCGYIHYEQGDKNCPLWITYGLNDPTKTSLPGDRKLSLGEDEEPKEAVRDVLYFCDCLPPNAPPEFAKGVYETR